MSEPIPAGGDPAISATVGARLDIPVERAGRFALSVAVAAGLDAAETLTIHGADGTGIPHHVLELDRGTRVHVVDAPVGRLSVGYEATVALGGADAVAVTERERFHYRLPSRYCPSDRVEGFAATEFGPVSDEAQAAQHIVAWVNQRLFYLPGSTTAADDALVPLGTGQGVCRDYAHLVVTLCRALGMPARYVSVYAPGLSPMDAHAVVEVAVDGVWRVFDATRLAPRASMVRIGTGRDAADSAILTALGGASQPATFTVLATSDPHLPVEDVDALVSLR
ncbi:MAG: transglutaminase family protein [Ornithinibacter sp.]